MYLGIAQFSSRYRARYSADYPLGIDPFHVLHFHVELSVVGNYDVIDVAEQFLEFGVGTWLPFDPGQIKMDTPNFSGRMDLIHTCIDPKQIGQCSIVFKPIVCWAE